ncbi:MAG: type II secretion system protein [Phycisphaerales bacterium]
MGPVAAWATAILLALGAAGKVPSAEGFAAVIGAVLGVDTARALPLAYAVIGWEACLAAALMWRGWRSAGTMWLALLTVGTFTLALARLALEPHAPRCGCLGVLGSLGSGGESTGWSLLRNAGLLGLLGWGLARGSGAIGRGSGHRGARAAGAGAGAGARAFTLTEVLVVAAVVCILLALALPAVRAARSRGREAEILSGLRQVSGLLVLYAGDHRDAWPYVQTPRRFDAPIVVRGVVTGFSYFGGGRTFWANALVPGYLEQPAFAQYLGTDAMAEWNTREGLPADTVRSRFVLCDVAFARAAWFEGDVPPVGEEHFDATRHGDVRFPGRKGALVGSTRRAGDNPDATGPWPVGRADGSAVVTPYLEGSPEFMVERWLWGVINAPVFSTRGGWGGVDGGL